MAEIFDYQVENPAEMPRLISFLSELLERVAEANDSSRRWQPQKVSAFHGLSRPSISIRSYLERIFQYANCSPCCFVVAYVYLDRFAQRQPLLPINSFNVHRLLITSVMVAAKFMDDMYYNNAYYAKIGGISTREMNFLEVDLLFGVGFHLNVTPTTFYSYCSYLQREMLWIQPPPPMLSADSSSLIMNVPKSLRSPHHPRPHNNSLCYVGGDTRIVVVDRNSTLPELLQRLSKILLSGRSFTLKYQLPNEDLDSLITVSSEEDLENMIDEYDRLNSGSNAANKAREWYYGCCQEA